MRAAQPTQTVLPFHTTSGAIVEGAACADPGGHMAAEVIGCGHSHHLFHEVSFMEGAPQVHIHFLTADDEFQRDGFGKIELVCHGCGAAQLVIYNGDGASISVRDGFKRAHKKCPNRGYEGKCLDYRSSMSVVDLRIKQEPSRPTRARPLRRRRRV